MSFTHFTGIWTLVSMYQLVVLQCKLLTKCLLTRITGIGAMASMCQLVSLQVTLLTKCHLHISQVYGHWSVCISWWFCNVNFLLNVIYTFHRYMDTGRYVSAGGSAM